jgi:hypothetical protein
LSPTGYCRGKPFWFTSMALPVRAVVGRALGARFGRVAVASPVAGRGVGDQHRLVARGAHGICGGRGPPPRQAVVLPIHPQGQRHRDRAAVLVPRSPASGSRCRPLDPVGPWPTGRRQTNPRAPTAPDGANVVTSGDLRHDGRCSSHPQLRISTFTHLSHALSISTLKGGYGRSAENPGIRPALTR